MAKKPKNTEGETDATLQPGAPVVAVSQPASNAKPADTGTSPANDPAGTSSTDAPRATVEGGAGDPAGPASPPSTDELIQEGKAAADQQADQVAGFLKLTEAEFREKFPLLAARADAWHARHPYVMPAALRITSRRDGFRRAGMAHSASPVDHPVGAFPDPAQVERLLAEPNLIVEFVAAEGEAA